MAGGIEWFRWHHGSVTDPKFQLVARKAAVSLPDVLAVWAFVLEKASAADERGATGSLDAEAIDCLFGFDDGDTASILTHMVARGLVSDGVVASWEKRQPRRERPDEVTSSNSSTERSRTHRAAKAQEAAQQHATPSDASSSHATPCNAMQRPE